MERHLYFLVRRLVVVVLASTALTAAFIYPSVSTGDRTAADAPTKAIAKSLKSDLELCNDDLDTLSACQRSALRQNRLPAISAYRVLAESVTEPRDCAAEAFSLGVRHWVEDHRLPSFDASHSRCEWMFLYGVYDSLVAGSDADAGFEELQRLCHEPGAFCWYGGGKLLARLGHSPSAEPDAGIARWCSQLDPTVATACVQGVRSELMKKR